jgi:uncharacterized protein YjiS (DUF1127 family)
MREGQDIARATEASATIFIFPRTPERGGRDAAVSPRGILALLRLWRRRWLARHEMRDLALLQPDSVLEDSGISREEAWLRARTPFWLP